ncbi:Thioredoxin [Chlamydia pneumoniae]|nr:Thioredoxin [Chlamydia pneumoniae]CRI36038.1 Thioredoxin [Chlamydia pneumoniae]CRI37165.1 Thioredoxin [Chlamydia pneumoniae]CRI38293.1 Thioredoxin [Chlamydia pneumoniae]CRI39425.1 Thioredoxin [Chlamydia pneumoniae]
MFREGKLMVKIISSENFDSFIASGLVLVDFFAEWCGPCRMLTPILENLAAELPHVTIGKINIDENSKPAETYEVSSIPTLILFKDGNEVARVVGLKDKEFLTNLINKHA